MTMANKTAGPLRVREADLGDIDALTRLATGIQNLHVQGRPDLFREADSTVLGSYMRSQLDSDALVLVAEIAQQVVGYALARHVNRPENPFRHASSLLYIDHFGVDPSVRRRHIGSVLMDELVRRALSDRVDSIHLDSWAFNEGAHAFFRNKGFESVNVVFERRLP